jgi:hypothetical protein
VGDPWDDEFQLANSIALLSYPVHVHSHLRPLRQGLVHVGLITWEGCHIFLRGGDPPTVSLSEAGSDSAEGGVDAEGDAAPPVDV